MLKPNDDYTGQGSFFGWEMNDTGWERALQQARRTPYVVQERVEPAIAPFATENYGHLEFQEMRVDLHPHAYLGKVLSCSSWLSSGGRRDSRPHRAWRRRLSSKVGSSGAVWGDLPLTIEIIEALLVNLSYSDESANGIDDLANFEFILPLHAGDDLYRLGERFVPFRQFLQPLVDVHRFGRRFNYSILCRR